MCLSALVGVSHRTLFLMTVPISIILSKPLDSPTLISCQSQKFRRKLNRPILYSRFGHFSLRVQKLSEICCHHRSQRHRFPIKVHRKIWQFDVLVDLWPTFYCACRNGHFRASGCNSDNAIGFSDLISYKVYTNKKKFVTFDTLAEKPPMDGFARNLAQGFVSQT